jgi:hypothetical protein
MYYGHNVGEIHRCPMTFVSFLRKILMRTQSVAHTESADEAAR